MSKSNREDRRTFLRALAGVCAGGAAYALLPQLEMAGRALAAEPGLNDYRALVCIYLRGGNDSFNMLVPYDAAEYAIYQQSRGGTYSSANPGGLAIGRDQLLPVRETTGKQWGLHPSCAGMKAMFDRGELSFLANVGTLAVPLSKDEFNRKAKAYPVELFSHNSQTTQWMRGTSSQMIATGWGGRVADQLRSLNAQTPLLPPGISVTGGGSTFQTGASTLPYAMFPSGPSSLHRFSGNGRQETIRANALNELLGRQYDSLMENRLALIGETSLELAKRTSQWLRPENGGDIQTVFPTGNRLAEQLRMVARLIKVGRSSAVGHKRQIFYAELGGFDTHRGQMDPGVQPTLLRQLSEGLQAFREALVELNALNDVTTFTISDFARTLNSNGSGSDHGWGGVQMVMGGSPAQGGSHAGGRVWGQYPLLELNGEQSLQRGQMVPTTSVTQYGATMANWLGVSRNDLNTIFPGLSGFSPTLLPIMG